ncbi:MAG: hypothetical protein Q4C95_11865 [Planctomycetia bacterium]|nr:hypothetical protein [Planctomycetia bacterium]
MSKQDRRLKESVLQALTKANGIVSDACKKAHISRTTFYEWVKSDEEFRKRVDEINDIAIDFVESKMFRLIQKGDGRMIQFFLSTKGKKRGYVTREEIREVRPPIIQVSQDEAKLFEEGFLGQEQNG